MPCIPMLPLLHGSSASLAMTPQRSASSASEYSRSGSLPPELPVTRMSTRAPAMPRHGLEGGHGERRPVLHGQGAGFDRDLVARVVGLEPGRQRRDGKRQRSPMLIERA